MEHKHCPLDFAGDNIQNPW